MSALDSLDRFMFALSESAPPEGPMLLALLAVTSVIFAMVMLAAGGREGVKPFWVLLGLSLVFSAGNLFMDRGGPAAREVLKAEAKALCGQIIEGFRTGELQYAPERTMKTIGDVCGERDLVFAVTSASEMYDVDFAERVSTPRSSYAREMHAYSG